MSANYTPAILLVDDNEDNLLTLEGNLRNLKVRFFSTQNGREAIELVKIHDFALIILDIQMPEMNGYETAEAIRQVQRNKHTPIIFLTAVYFDHVSVYKGYQTGAVDYITKPFNREILVTKTRVFLELDMIKHELSQSKKEFQSIVQDQTDLIVRTDENNSIIFANRALLIAFTKTFDGLKSCNFLDWISEKDCEKIIKAIEVLSPSNAIVKIHHSLNVLTSRQIFVSTIIRALYDSNNELTGFQYVMRDISKEVENREELIFAKKKAEEATKSKSQFLANMSHEIRTPMNSILGMIDVLMQTNLDEDQLEDVEVIKYSATNLLDILNDILDFSRIEANQIQIQNIWFNLNEELKKIIKLLENKAKEKGNILSLETFPDIPQKVKGDPLRLGQIIINLLNNAIKFTENGTVKLAVGKDFSKEKTSLFKFTITDTGIGMPEKISASLFKFYQQGDLSIAREYGGSGLGLAISKSLCELMGGSISFKSEVDKGSSFWFSIALEEEEKTEKTEKTRVLVVEDNPLNQRIVGATLQKNNLGFDLASNGKIAVEKVLKNDYTLILMDIQMPVMDGYEATRQIREFENSNPDREKACIIALTANATKEDRERSEKTGMNDYLTKPFKFADLENILQKFNIIR
jgi:PAS domain S-box-containing protein